MEEGRLQGWPWAIRAKVSAAVMQGWGIGLELLEKVGEKPLVVVAS